jgi:hypothetical protein
MDCVPFVRGWESPFKYLAEMGGVLEPTGLGDPPWRGSFLLADVTCIRLEVRMVRSE